MTDREILLWLLRRAALLLVAFLAIVAIPLALLAAVPVGYFAEHAVFHAVWQALVIFGGGWIAVRGVVRWSRVPREIVGAVMLAAAAVFSFGALIALRGTRAQLQYVALALLLGTLASINVLALHRAWRAGWRPSGLPNREASAPL